jgi:hypothetical protein
MKTFRCRKRTARIVFASVTIAAFACLSGLAFAGGGGSNGNKTFVPQLGITVPSDKAVALQHTLSVSGGSVGPINSVVLRDPSLGGAPVKGSVATLDPIPATIVGPDVPVPISPAILQATNGWIVSDGSTLVAVYAGASGEDSRRGRLAIVRQDLAKGKQTVDVVDAGTGALTIVEPPLGAAVETSAQQGRLTVLDANGVRQTLELSTDQVEVPAS